MLVALFATSGVAHASFKGTPGKVAYVDKGDANSPLKLWDPVAAAVAPADPQAGVTTIAPYGTGQPAWSPDGTRIAYVGPCAGEDGSGVTGRCTDIWVYDLRTQSAARVTHSPSETCVQNPDPTQDDACTSRVDLLPEWIGSDVVMFGTENFDDLGPNNDCDYWTVSASGANLTRVTHGCGTAAGAAVYGGMPRRFPGTNAVLLKRSPGCSLVRLDLGTEQATTVVPSDPCEISDYDLSPDGTQVAYERVGAGTFVRSLGSAGVVGPERASGGGAAAGQPPRFSTDGNGLLSNGCSTRVAGACGVIERLLPDEGGDVQSGEPDRLLLSWTLPTAAAGRSGEYWDVQPQALPVVFVPGFLGSVINCGSSELWPNGGVGANLTDMSLNFDGVTNKFCAGAGPTANRDIVRTVAGSTVYDGMATFLESTLGKERVHLFGWDWRKTAAQSVSALDDAITQALAAPCPAEPAPCWKNQGANRVVLIGHSYGGLLMRTYLSQQSHDARVARALTVGTPYWGSPKAIFPLAFGIETPNSSVLDGLLNNTNLEAFAKNLAGLYQLLPSPSYPAWFSVTGHALTTPRDYVNQVLGNVPLFDQAQAFHSSCVSPCDIGAPYSTYEGFYDNGGRIDVRAVVGTGVPTLGGVTLDSAVGGKTGVDTLWITGDGTVPGRSANQGDLGSPGRGDPAHIQYLCGVEHTALPNDVAFQNAYRDWIDYGRTPRKVGKVCMVKGASLKFDATNLIHLATPASHKVFAHAAADAAPAMTLEQASAAGLITLLKVPATVIAATDDTKPVTLRVELSNGTFTWTPFSDAGPGVALTYGPVSGTIDIGPGSVPGGSPRVTANGVVIQPTSGTGGATNNPGGTTTGSTASNKFTVVGRARLRRRVITLTVSLPGPGTVRLKVTTTAKRAKTLATKTVKATKKGKLKLTLRLRRTPPAKLRLAITFTPKGGKPATKKLSLRR